MPRTHNVNAGDIYADVSVVYYALREADCLDCLDQVMDNMSEQGFYIGKDRG